MTNIRLAAPDPTELERRRNDALARAAEKPVRLLLQVDGFPDIGEGDCVMRPDSDGDTVFSGMGYELSNCGDEIVRVQYPPTMPAATVLRMLDKIAEWIRRDPTVGMADAEFPNVEFPDR